MGINSPCAASSLSWLLLLLLPSPCPPLPVADLVHRQQRLWLQQQLLSSPSLSPSSAGVIFQLSWTKIRTSALLDFFCLIASSSATLIFAASSFASSSSCQILSFHSIHSFSIWGIWYATAVRSIIAAATIRGPVVTMFWLLQLLIVLSKRPVNKITKDDHLGYTWKDTIVWISYQNQLSLRHVNTWWCINVPEDHTRRMESKNWRTN